MGSVARSHALSVPMANGCVCLSLQLCFGLSLSRLWPCGGGSFKKAARSCCAFMQNSPPVHVHLEANFLPFNYERVPLQLCPGKHFQLLKLYSKKVKFNANSAFFL
jgi:hypothetical protein